MICKDQINQTLSKGVFTLTFINQFNFGFSISHYLTVFNLSKPFPRHFSFLSERRPLKSTVLMPLFQSPSSRLNSKDIMEDDRGCSVDGLNLTSSLEGSHNEALHYSFMPNKQIVSRSFSLFILFFILHEHFFP